METTNKSPGFLHIIMSEILGEPKADILDYLIQHSKSQTFIPVTEISSKLRRKREPAKVYQYLNELKQDHLVASSGGRPLSYKIVSRALIVKRLTEIAEQQNESKKKKLDNQLIDIKNRLSTIPVSEDLLDPDYLPPALSPIKKGQLDTVLSESLDMMGVGESVLCEAPSISFLLPPKISTSRFGRILNDRLADKSLGGVRCVCNRETALVGDGDPNETLNLLEKNIKSGKFDIVFDGEISLATPMTVIFGKRRTVISLAHAVKNQPIEGFLMEGYDTIKSIIDRFSKTFEDAKKENISSYLDGLRSKQKAGVKESETRLEKIVRGSLGDEFVSSGWQEKRWSEIKEPIIARMGKEKEDECLRDQNLAWLSSSKKKICVA
jgi:hypothetical protein